MAFPGVLTRGEIATGLLIRSIKVNGNYLLLSSCSINIAQEIETKVDYIQGGPGSAISDIKEKKITGNIKFPLRVDSTGAIELAASVLLTHAENPITALTIDTNHVLVHALDGIVDGSDESFIDLTAEYGGTDDNFLLSIDKAVVKSLTISAEEGGEVNVSVDIEGMIDYAVPDTTDIMGRALSWADCDVFRSESAMRNASSIEITITNTIETPVFLLPGNTAFQYRSDQIQFIGVKSIKWAGRFTEVLRKGVDLNTHIHGGWMVNEDLTMKFGPITALFHVPLFNIAELPLSSKAFIRTTKFTGIINPTAPLSAAGLFTFN